MMAKGKIVAKIKRKKGMLYYADASGNVRETPMKRKKAKKNK